jgi:GNAT superfamily N-acetyltransferase
MTTTAPLPPPSSIGRHQTRALAALLATAFDEPVTRWLIPDPTRRHPVMTRFFTLILTDAFTTGTIDVLTDHDTTPLAAVIWAHPTDSDPDADPHQPDHDRYAQVFGPDTGRWHTLDRLLTQRHPTSPYGHALFAAVRPDHQRQRLGTRLLTHRLRRLDAAGTPSYLEATVRHEALHNIPGSAGRDWRIISGPDG